MRQRPRTLRSKVVTTKIQLDINVEKLLLNRGCLNRASRNSDPVPTASTAAGNQSVMKQCGGHWQAGKGGWNNRRRNLATIPEILPGAVRLGAKRSAAGRICASSAGSCSYVSADAIGFTVSVAAASGSTGWKSRVDWKRICAGAGSSGSLSGINCRVGQRAFAYLPFPGHPGLRPHEKRGLHVRGGGPDFR